ncbi:unnamed protein product [Amoebophrya sp. A120]|nr:unnamed protein product [Amoebophrya sp. A120]|eukprot:GSA120T00013853001.1
MSAPAEEPKVQEQQQATVAPAEEKKAEEQKVAAGTEEKPKQAEETTASTTTAAAAPATEEKVEQTTTSNKRPAEDSVVAAEEKKEEKKDGEQEQKPAAEEQTAAASAPPAKKQKLNNNKLNVATDQGILITAANSHALKPAIHDCLNILKRAFPDTATAGADDKAGKRFELCNDHKLPFGIGFVKCNQSPTAPLTASACCSQMFEKFQNKQENSHHIFRLLPCDFLCKPDIEEFKKLAEKHIKPLFPKTEKAEDKKLTWALNFKTRAVKKINKDLILQVIDQWTDGYKVSLDNPEVCIQIEVNPVFIGLALIDNHQWGKFIKYNVQSVLNPAQAAKEAEKHRSREKANQAKKAEKAAAASSTTGVEKKAEEKKEEAAAACATAETKTEAPAPAVAEKEAAKAVVEGEQAKTATEKAVEAGA